MKTSSIVRRLLALTAAVPLLIFTANSDSPIQPDPNPTPVQVTCFTSTQAGTATGCKVGLNCPWFEPNVGINWQNSWQCCYTNGSLSSYTPATCTSFLNGGCCNNIDTTAHCANTAACPLKASAIPL